MKLLLTALLATITATSLFGQTLVQLQPSSFHFYSYSPVSQPIPPPGYIQLLTFPDQSTGGNDVLAGCRTYTELTANHFNWDFSGQFGPEHWSGPVTGDVFHASPTMFDSTIGGPSTGSWGGLAIDASFEGTIATNSSPSTQNFIQATFFHDNPCFELGPEFGFYKLFINPGDATSNNTIYFYYAINGNCYIAGDLGSCRSRADGSTYPVRSTSVPITLPVGTNSQGGTNWLYSAYLSSATNFHITIRDPYTLANAVTPVDSPVESYYLEIASQQYNYGLRGWISTTQQRTSTDGGITEDPMNPLKIITRSIAKILPVAVVAGSGSLFGMERQSGWCENGGRTVTIGSNTAAQRVQGSYPSCQVAVYITGTSTLATIYSDNSGTPKSNPFTASSSGFWFYYANNGTYDVTMSGGSPSFPAPVTIGAITSYDASSSTIIGPFTLPSIGTGCWYDGGTGVITNVGCSVGGGANSVQFNNAGSFGGSSSFTYNDSTKVLAIDGQPSTAAISVVDGNVTSAEGFVSNYASYNGFRASSSGADIRGLKLQQRSASTTGGYAQFVPLSGLTYPTTLDNGSFGGNDGLLWVSASNGTVTPNISVGLNTNLYLDAAGGVRSNNTSFNTIQTPSGGMYGLSFTALNYVNSGSHNGTPSVTTNDSFNPGAMYYDTGANCEKVYDGSSWSCLGSGGGGGGTPGGSNTQVQYNNSGSFGGSANFVWNNALQILQVTALNSSSAAIAAATGFIQSDKGFLATGGTCTNYNCIQAPGGGQYAKSFTALKYIQTGNNNGVPSLTTGDSFIAGALYWDTGTNGLQVYDGSAWQSLGGGSGTPGGATTNVQFNAAGSFAGSSDFTWTAASKVLQITALNSTSAGIAVATGFIQSDKGFLATSGVCTNYNCIQAPDGGLAGRSVTLTKYMQPGNGTTDPTVSTGDTFNAGAMYYNTSDACLKIHNGTSFSCITGSGGTPGGSNTQVQYNNSGAFGGSANFVWNNASQLLTITAPSAVTAGIAVANGYIHSDGGLVAYLSTNYNSIQSVNGGVFGRNLTALKYIQTGNNSGVPTVSTGDTFNAGAMFWDTAAGVEKIFNGSIWVNVATTGGTVTSINTITGALNLNGTTNQVLVSTSAPNLTLSLPQSIATSSNVTFGSVTTSSGATPVFQSGATGTQIAFQTTNFNFQVDGNGAVSGQNFYAGGGIVINSFRQFVGTGVLVGPSGGVGALGFNPYNTGTASYATGYSPGTPTTLPVGARPIVLGGIVVGYI